MKITTLSSKTSQRMSHAGQSTISNIKKVKTVYVTRSFSTHGGCYLLGLLPLTLCRAPDNSKVKQKMMFASSKDALRAKLQGIAFDIQCTDESERAYDTGTFFIFAFIFIF